MSDLSLTRDALHRAASQLPVASYFDAVLFQRELETLFRPGTRYIGHDLSVPALGDFHTLAQEGEGRALVRTADGVELLSNVCRHRQALMLHGRGSAQGKPGSIVCPLHRWTYDLHGRLIGAPHFEQDPCLHLANYPLQSWNGLLFEAGGRRVATDLAALGARADLDFSGYVYDRTHLHECDYNWKSFIEVYLEDYHVGPYHPGLSNFVSCDNLQWELGRDYSVPDGRRGALGRRSTGPCRLARLPALAGCRAALSERHAAALRRSLVDLLPWRDGRVVPQRAGGLDPDPEGPAQDPQCGRVLLPRGNRGLRARVRSGATGCLPGDLLSKTMRSRFAWMPAAGP